MYLSSGPYMSASLFPSSSSSACFPLFFLVRSGDQSWTKFAIHVQSQFNHLQSNLHSCLAIPFDPCLQESMVDVPNREGPLSQRKAKANLQGRPTRAHDSS